MAEVDAELPQPVQMTVIAHGGHACLCPPSCDLCCVCQEGLSSSLSNASVFPESMRPAFQCPSPGTVHSEQSLALAPSEDLPQTLPRSLQGSCLVFILVTRVYSCSLPFEALPGCNLSVTDESILVSDLLVFSSSRRALDAHRHHLSFRNKPRRHTGSLTGSGLQGQGEKPQILTLC